MEASGHCMIGGETCCVRGRIWHTAVVARTIPQLLNINYGTLLKPRRSLPQECCEFSHQPLHGASSIRACSYGYSSTSLLYHGRAIIRSHLGADARDP